MANENPKLTITLTGRPPVKITKDEWPVIASADDKEYDNQARFDHDFVVSQIENHD